MKFDLRPTGQTQVTSERSSSSEKDSGMQKCFLLLSWTGWFLNVIILYYLLYWYSQSFRSVNSCRWCNWRWHIAEIHRDIQCQDKAIFALYWLASPRSLSQTFRGEWNSYFLLLWSEHLVTRFHFWKIKKNLDRTAIREFFTHLGHGR